ncbi:MAG TPA: thioredoxin domain-containing protein, partial [Terrimesophilobacter sp.]|nr:thioredoxin domain-containing protein [Terrimesophilobacter sp.]
SFKDFVESLGVTDQDTLDCVFEGRYMSWVAANTDVAMSSGVTGTPSLWVNGQQPRDANGNAILLSSQDLFQTVAELANSN